MKLSKQKKEELITILKEMSEVPIIGESKKSDLPSPTVLKFSKAERFDG
jgi:hypothetical protein